jgi:hypothetical protein
LMLGRKERRDSIDGGVNSDVWRLRCVAEVYLYVMKDLEKKWYGKEDVRTGLVSTRPTRLSVTSLALPLYY